MGFRTETPQQKRKAAIEERLKSNKEELVQDLLVQLKLVESEKVAVAAEAFAWVRDERSIPPLLELLGHSDEWVRDRSGYALARMWRSALPLMTTSTSKARHAKFEHLVRTFVRIGKPAVPQLLEMLQGKEQNQQKSALKSLCQIAFPIEDLQETLQSSEDRLKGDVFEILGKSKKVEAIQLVLEEAPVGKESRKKQKIALGKLARHFPREITLLFHSNETSQAQQQLICTGLLTAGNLELVVQLSEGMDHLKAQGLQARARLKAAFS